MKIDYASLLNPTQLEAVTTPKQHVRIIAGAGSGKTRVLTYRIAFLIDEVGVDPQAILAMTFTNKAAKEMQSRVAELVPGCGMFLQISTFHSFCAKFLRKEIYRLDFPLSFTIFDDEDQEKLIKAIGEAWGYKKSDPLLKQALIYIGSKKNRGLYPENIKIQYHSFEGEAECLRFYKEYEDRKREMHCLDFDDLMLYTLKILEEFPEARAAWANRFQHILVDEFQDTNDVQFKLMRYFSTPATYIYVVGDPDQTIYTWRGANQKLILDFPNVYPDYADVVLDRNYRSTKNILAAANRLIKHNVKRVPKNLYTEGAEGKPVTARKFDSAKGEAEFIVREIQRIAEAEYPPFYRNIAVLYRSSYLTRPLEAELGARGMPYRVFGGLRFYQRREIKDVLAYFRLFLNSLDDVAFTRIYNVPKRGIGDASFEKFVREAKDLGLSLYDYAAELEQHPDTELPKKAVTQLILLTTQMEAVKTQLKDNYETYSSILRKFITDIGYYDYIVEDQAIDEDRAGNVNALFDDINGYISQHPESTFDEYLQNIALLTSQDDMNDGNYISLMTIHVAKGLEFDHVFVMGMNHGSFPSARAEAEDGRDGVEEERRLAYVAFTRAKKTLTLTCNTGYSYVSGSNQPPSCFFEEAGFDFPKESLYSQVYGNRGFGGRKENGWPKVSFGQRQTRDFDDGDHFDPFAPSEPVVEKKEDNGITDWCAGDRMHHEKFGDGTVLRFIEGAMIEVLFDNGAKRTLVSTHPMISRITKPGGTA